jgi:hypothetical protein
MDEDGFSAGCKRDLEAVIAKRVQDFRCGSRAGRPSASDRNGAGFRLAGSRSRALWSLVSLLSLRLLPHIAAVAAAARLDSGLQDACEEDLETTCSTSKDDMKDEKKRQTALNCLQASGLGGGTPRPGARPAAGPPCAAWKPQRMRGAPPPPPPPAAP